MQTFEGFKRAQYFPTLDGLRAISVILVLFFHTGDKLWQPLHGYLGVTVFFIISGFLITTLLLREEDRYGRASIWRFYIRRIFRIFPLYYLALGTVSLLVLGFGMGSDPDSYPARLLLLATYNGEFSGGGTFGHSWSLGIEEKFYLVWPILGFVLAPLIRRRLLMSVVLLLGSIATAPFASWNYFAIYTPILAGVVSALLMHREKFFGAVQLLARPLPGALVLTAASVALLVNDELTYVHVPFSILAALCMPLFLIGARQLRAVLSWKPLRHLGTRAYGIYLFHPLLLEIVERGLPRDDSSTPVTIARMALLAVSSLAVAELLYRWFEAPLIAVGRKLTGGKLVGLQPVTVRDS